MRSFSKPKANILDFFREGFVPREMQANVLRQVEECWDDTDVILIRADVGAGKSLLADCIGRWNYEKNSESCSIIMPNNNLVNQYRSSFPDMASIGSKSTYGGCKRAWGEARAAFTEAPIKVGNYYTYLAHRAYSPVLIVDECHALVDTLLEFDTVKLWRHLLPFPEFSNVLELFIWAGENKDVDKRIAKVYEMLKRNPREYTIKFDKGIYRQHEQDVLKIIPLTPRNNKPFFWPWSVRKIILMSATIGEDDLYDFGLERRRVKLIDGGSPIPKERRPIVYDPVGNMSFNHQEANMPKFMERMQMYAERHRGSKGMIHTTYAMAKVMRAHVPPSLKDKLMFHNSMNKARVLGEFLASAPEEGKILVGCGMSEGLDLKEDLCRWQVISKIMYPNKSDFTVASKMKIRPQWYNWAAIRELEQSRGRVCRGPEDYGITYITDSSFVRLYNTYNHLFSLPFREALS